MGDRRWEIEDGRQGRAILFSASRNTIRLDDIHWMRGNPVRRRMNACFTGQADQAETFAAFQFKRDIVDRPEFAGAE